MLHNNPYHMMIPGRSQTAPGVLLRHPSTVRAKDSIPTLVQINHFCVQREKGDVNSQNALYADLVGAEKHGSY